MMIYFYELLQPAIQMKIKEDRWDHGQAPVRPEVLGWVTYDLEVINFEF